MKRKNERNFPGPGDYETIPYLGDPRDPRYVDPYDDEWDFDEGWELEKTTGNLSYDNDREKIGG